MERRIKILKVSVLAIVMLLMVGNKVSASVEWTDSFKWKVKFEDCGSDISILTAGYCEEWEKIPFTTPEPVGNTSTISGKKVARGVLVGGGHYSGRARNHTTNLPVGLFSGQENILIEAQIEKWTNGSFELFIWEGAGMRGLLNLKTGTAPYSGSETWFLNQSIGNIGLSIMEGEATVQVELDVVNDKGRLKVVDDIGVLLEWTEWIDSPWVLGLHSGIGFAVENTHLSQLSMGYNSLAPQEPEGWSSIARVDTWRWNYREYDTINEKWDAGYNIKGTNTFPVGLYDHLSVKLYDDTDTLKHTATIDLKRAFGGNEVSFSKNIAFQNFSSGNYKMTFMFCDTETSSCQAMFNTFLFRLSLDDPQKTKDTWIAEQWEREQEAEEFTGLGGIIQRFINDSLDGLFSKFPFNWVKETYQIIQEEKEFIGVSEYPDLIITATIGNTPMEINMFNIEEAYQNQGIADGMGTLRTILKYVLWLTFIMFFIRRTERIVLSLMK